MKHIKMPIALTLFCSLAMSSCVFNYAEFVPLKETIYI